MYYLISIYTFSPGLAITIGLSLSQPETKPLARGVTGEPQRLRNDGDVGRVFNAYDTPYHRRRSLSRARMGPISAVTAFRFVLATVGAGT